MTDAQRYAVWPEPRSRSLKGSRPSVPHGTNFISCLLLVLFADLIIETLDFITTLDCYYMCWLAF